jgi:hypothetical protein
MEIEIEIERPQKVGGREENATCEALPSAFYEAWESNIAMGKST